MSLSAAPGFSVSLVTGGLPAPIAEEAAPDGRLFVAEQSGSVRIIQSGKLLAAPFVTLPVDFQADRGLFGVALDPKFSSDHFVYLYYTVPGNAAQDIAPHNRVVRFTANGNVAIPGSEKTLFDLDPLGAVTDHDTGALHFGGDGKLYISVGDTGTANEAQTTDNLLGKILRINPDGSIPTDDPFYKTATGNERAIWAIGFHNPFTFATQPGGSLIFVNDVGENTQEEIDNALAGADYGWPATSGPFSQAQFPQYLEPFYSYNAGAHATSGAAITGGAFYDPATQQFPASYRGEYFFADYAQGWIKALNLKTRAVTTIVTGLTHPVDVDVAGNGVIDVLENDGGPAGSAGAIEQIRWAGATPALAK